MEAELSAHFGSSKMPKLSISSMFQAENLIGSIAGRTCVSEDVRRPAKKKKPLNVHYLTSLKTEEQNNLETLDLLFLGHISSCLV